MFKKHNILKLNKTKSFQKLNILILILNLVSLTYLLNLSFYSRLIGDDIILNSNIKVLNPFEYVNYVYNTWTGRFTAVFMQYFIFSIYNLFHSVLLNLILLLLIGYFSIYKFFNLFFKNFSKYQISNISFFVLNILILSSFEIYTIFWVTTQIYYFNIFIFFFLISYILKIEETNFDNFFIILLSFYIGGIGEHISSVYLFALLISLSKNTIPEKIKTKIKISFIISLISFIILLLAPGNFIRNSYSINSSFNDLFQNSQFVILKMLIFVLFKSIYFLVLFFVFYNFGIYSKKNIFMTNNWIFAVNFNLTYKFKIIFLFIIFFIIVQLPAIIFISNSLPRWSSIHLNLIIILFIFFFSFNYGYNSVLKQNILISTISKFFLIILITTVSYFYYYEYKIVKTFAYNYDKNIYTNNKSFYNTKYNSIFYTTLEIILGKNKVNEVLFFINHKIVVPKSINISDKNKYLDFFLYRSPFYTQ